MRITIETTGGPNGRRRSLGPIDTSQPAAASVEPFEKSLDYRHRSPTAPPQATVEELHLINVDDGDTDVRFVDWIEPGPKPTGADDLWNEMERVAGVLGISWQVRD